MVSSSRILTIAVIGLALAVVSVVLYTQLSTTRNSYDQQIEVSFRKSQPAYDYSCNENDYQIFFAVKNTGSRNVLDLSVSITNPLCVGAISALPHSLNDSSSSSSNLSFYAQSTEENGTLTISGNNTFVQIKF